MTLHVDMDAERRVASWYLALGRAHPRTSRVRPECLSHPRLRAAWAAACERDTWTSDELATWLGGWGEVSSLSDMSPLSGRDLDALERRVIDAWGRRHVAQGLGDALDDLRSGRVDLLADIAERVRGVLGEAEAGSLRGSRPLGDVIETMADRWVREAKASADKPRTIPMPVYPLQVRCAWQRGRLSIVGARSSEHKTTFARASTWYAARHGFRALHWTMEDEAEDLAARTVSAEVSELRWGDLVRGVMTEDNSTADVAVQVRKLRNSDAADRLSLLDARAPKLAQVLGTLRAEAARGLDIVVLDYIQLIQHDQGRERDADWWRRVTAELARFAHEAKCAVVCTSQIDKVGNRNSNTGTRLTVPMASDMLFSSSLIQDAFLVLMLGYVEECGRKHFEVVIEKNKCGASKIRIPLAIDPVHDKIQDQDT
jgi:replicative DNA helicase